MSDAIEPLTEQRARGRLLAPGVIDIGELRARHDHYGRPPALHALVTRLQRRAVPSAGTNESLLWRRPKAAGSDEGLAVAEGTFPGFAAPPVTTQAPLPSARTLAAGTMDDASADAQPATESPAAMSETASAAPQMLQRLVTRRLAPGLTTAPATLVQRHATAGVVNVTGAAVSRVLTRSASSPPATAVAPASAPLVATVDEHKKRFDAASTAPPLLATSHATQGAPAAASVTERALASAAAAPIARDDLPVTRILRKVEKVSPQWVEHRASDAPTPSATHQDLVTTDARGGAAVVPTRHGAVHLQRQLEPVPNRALARPDPSIISSELALAAVRPPQPRDHDTAALPLARSLPAQGRVGRSETAPTPMVWRKAEMPTVRASRSQITSRAEHSVVARQRLPDLEPAQEIASATAAPESSSELDIDWVTEQVSRRLVRRLEIERERMGVRLWR